MIQFKNIENLKKIKICFTKFMNQIKFKKYVFLYFNNIKWIVLPKAKDGWRL